MLVIALLSLPMSPLLTYKEFVAERRAEEDRLAEERAALMRAREQLVRAHQQHLQERLPQLDAFEELLGMRDRRVGGGMAETATATATTTVTTVPSAIVAITNACPSPKPHLQATIEESKRITRELSRLRQIETYLEVLLFLQQSMYFGGQGQAPRMLTLLLPHPPLL